MISTCRIRPVSNHQNTIGHPTHPSYPLIVVEFAVNRIPVDLRAEVISIIERSKMNATQKRNLAKKGLPRNVADEIDILWEIGTFFTSSSWGIKAYAGAHRRRCR